MKNTNEDYTSFVITEKPIGLILGENPADGKTKRRERRRKERNKKKNKI